MQPRKHYQCVLIVDDMAVNRKILASLLASNGIDSDLAESGKECIRLCEERNYDLILLDHRMPDLDGVETLLRLKEIFLAKGKDIPVVCHTTEEARPNVNLYKAAGFADVLFKPIQPQELSDILISLLFKSKNAYSEKEAQKQRLIKAELDLLPEAVRNIPGIDPVSGITYCETASDYMEALRVFASSIHTKAAEIEHYKNAEDLSMYMTRLHSLKSTARLIGAKELSELAAQFEQAAKDGDSSLSFEGAESVLSIYRGLETALEIALHAEIDSSPTDVLLIEGAKGFLYQAVISSLENAGMSVICIEDGSIGIASYCERARVIVYYPAGNASQIDMTMDYLLNITEKEHKSLCLVGEESQIARAKESDKDGRVFAVYTRPVNTTKLANDIKRLVGFRRLAANSRTILIVDDDKDFQTIVKGWLKNVYQTDSAFSGKEALSYLSHKHPDLILMDYELPDTDGYEVMDKIRRKQDTAAIPIIFLTGKSDRDSVMKILKRKPDGYLLKPMTKDNLLDTLERFFEQSFYSEK